MVCVICDNCETEVKIVYRSIGRLQFCHKCAHYFGLVHKHQDVDGAHIVGLSKKQLKQHLKEYETDVD